MQPYDRLEGDGKHLKELSPIIRFVPIRKSAASASWNQMPPETSSSVSSLGVLLSSRTVRQKTWQSSTSREGRLSTAGGWNSRVFPWATAAMPSPAGCGISPGRDTASTRLESELTSIHPPAGNTRGLSARILRLSPMKRGMND